MNEALSFRKLACLINRVLDQEWIAQQIVHQRPISEKH